MNHDHAAHHHHHADKPHQAGSPALRMVIALLLVAVALLAATLIVVPQGSVQVITRFGNPVRIHLEPGLHWRLPAPIERVVDVDVRQHTTGTGLHDVGTKDGLRLQIAAYLAWKIPAEEKSVLQYVRSVRGVADEAAVQIRSFLGSALETEVSRYALSDLVNTDKNRVLLETLEIALRKRLVDQVRDMYGIEVVQVGIERLGLPQSTLNVTIERMIAERQTAAATKKAKGSQLAAEIIQGAFREQRIIKAKAEEDAAAIEAKARTDAAAIYAQAHKTDPELYNFLRGLDALDKIITGSTRIIVRTDAAPFKALVEGPGFVPPPAQAPGK
jgi:modulator of FtsH protease HflC